MADIWINVLGDASKLKGALGEAGSQVDKFAERIGKIGKTMTIVGGAVTAAFGMIVKKTMDVGDQFDKMSLRTGVAVEDLSTLGYAADICGTDIGTVENSLRFLVRAMSDTSKGVGESKEAFDKLGVSVTDTEGNLRPTIEVMKEAATKIATMTNETEQINIATRIFGTRYGTQLLPMLKTGGKGIEELMQKARDLNLEISTESAKASATFKDTLGDLTKSLGSLGREIGEILIPPLTELAKKAVEVIKRITEWVKENPKLVETITKIGAVLGALCAVGGPILMAASAFMKAKMAIAAIGTVASGPIGIVIAAVAGLALAWTTNFGGIRDFTIAVVDKVKEALGWLWDKVKWVLEKLGLYEEKTGEVEVATEELTTSLETASTAVDNLAGENEELSTSFDNVKTGAEEATEAIKIYAEDVAENYIELASKSADSWEDFYRFWEAEAKRTADEVIETIEEVGKKTSNIIQKIEDEAGKITGVILPGGGTITVAGEEIPSYKPGISYVPKTQLALIHEGEEINPPGQRTYDQRKREINININNPVVRNDGDITKIRQQVEMAFWEFVRQYGRSGFELPV